MTVLVIRCGCQDMLSACDTTCRCSNFIRTGDVDRPDGLLCLMNKTAAQATVKALAGFASNPQMLKEQCYA
jgi:hypothetical protein